MSSNPSAQLTAFLKRPIGIVLIALIAVAVVCCCGSAIYGAFGPDSPEPSPASTSRSPSPSPSPSMSSAAPTLAPVVVEPTPAVPAPATTKAAPKPSKTTSAPKPACHPNYSACLPITNDVDCGETSHRNFLVIGSDPYRLDADNDGIACESN